MQHSYCLFEISNHLLIRTQVEKMYEYHEISQLKCIFKITIAKEVNLQYNSELVELKLVMTDQTWEN